MSSTACIPGFEGSEKKLVVDFVSSVDEPNLRLMPRAQIDAFLTAAKCTIISQLSSDSFDSYVLSESSLFIYPNQIIVKTCGTTKSALALGCSPSFVAFSRANYRFPDVQPDVHRNFDSEIRFLNKYFPMGQSYILGPLNGPRWHLYLAHVADRVHQSHIGEQTFEVVMTDLPASAMAPFYRLANDPDALVYNAPAVTDLTGIDQLLPGALIDGFLFEPCGYSCNAVRGSEYFTIHITPEPSCSFVSFETNAPLGSYNELLQKVLAIFRPGNFSVSVFVDDHAPLLCNSQLALDWEYLGYERDDCCYQEFGFGCNISYGNFVSHSSDCVSSAPLVVKVPESCESDSKMPEKLEESKSDYIFKNDQVHLHQDVYLRLAV